MGLKTLVKVGSITSLSDARYCAGMGVDLLGFNVDPGSDDYVTPESFKEITGWVSGVDLVVETGAVQLPDLEDYSHTYIQIINRFVLSEININDSKTILEVDINQYTLPELLSLGKSSSEYVTYYLFEKAPDDLHEGTEIINSFAVQYPVFWGFDVSVETLDKILATRVKGIAMHGTIEDNPGLKSYDELAEVLEYLEEE